MLTVLQGARPPDEADGGRAHVDRVRQIAAKLGDHAWIQQDRTNLRKNL